MISSASVLLLPDSSVRHTAHGAASSVAYARPRPRGATWSRGRGRGAGPRPRGVVSRAPAAALETGPKRAARPRGQLLLQALESPARAARARPVPAPAPGSAPQPAVEPARSPPPAAAPSAQPLESVSAPAPSSPGSGITLLAYCQVAAGAAPTSVRHARESGRGVSSVQPSRKRLSCSASAPPGVRRAGRRHSAANRPCSSRLWYTQSPVPSTAAPSPACAAIDEQKAVARGGSWSRCVTSPERPVEPFRGRRAG